MNLEICCGDIGSLHAAVAGGATRVELCAALGDGGVTPAISLVRAAANMHVDDINALIRPRGGDFLFTAAEAEAMAEDVRDCISAGATGIVVGALTADGNIDMDICSALMSAGRECARMLGRTLSVTFHRAFDMCADWHAALDGIVGLGCNCILTSGQASNAEEGIPMLREMAEYAAGRIDIMAGGGVTVDNVARIAHSGVNLVHTSARTPHASAMMFRRGGVSMGAPGADEYCRLQTDAATVKELMNILLHHEK